MLAVELSVDPSELQPLGEYNFESNFNERKAREWTRENWHKSVFFAVAYLTLVFGIQHFMKKWRGYQLHIPLILWSFSLALFSAIGALWIWKQMVLILSTKGLKQSVCSQSFYVHPISKLWIYLFVLSKLWSQKKKLIFLNWYHHSTTLIVTWYGCKDMVAGIGWPAALNFSIHAIMCLYYTVRATGFQVPCSIAMAITISQVLQMLVYVIMNILIIFWIEDKVCHTTWTIIFLTSVLYVSFLVLFCNYFFHTCLKSTQKTKRE